MGYNIRKVKTWHGVKWAVVDSEGFSIVFNKRVAQFPNDKEGLEEARKILKKVKK